MKMQTSEAANNPSGQHHILTKKRGKKKEAIIILALRRISKGLPRVLSPSYNMLCAINILQKMIRHPLSPNHIEQLCNYQQGLSKVCSAPMWSLAWLMIKKEDICHILGHNEVLKNGLNIPSVGDFTSNSSLLFHLADLCLCYTVRVSILSTTGCYLE